MWSGRIRGALLACLSGLVLAGCSSEVPKPKPAAESETAQKADKDGPSKAQTAKQGEAQRPADAAEGPVSNPGPKPVKREVKRRGHSYDGKEFEVVRGKDGLDAIDRWTLKQRKKQPIYFLGLPMRQIPSDNWLMSELLYEIKPDFIVEAGTLHGGSAVYYAALLEFINPDGRVLTIDINEDQIAPEAKAHALWGQRVEFLKGSSTAPEIHEQLAKRIGADKRVFVTIDTLHAPKHVSRELELYAEYVSPGSYMILQDTYYEGLPEVLDAFLASHPDWERVDTLDERFVFTKYRGGFLRKKQAAASGQPAEQSAEQPVTGE